MKREGSSRPSGRLVPLRVRKALPSKRDDRVVAAIRRGDEAAFEEVYRRHVGELLRFCVYMVASVADAEDALQATFVSAYRALLADSRPVAMRPWLFTIARNECLSTLRHRRDLVELNGEVALTGDPVMHMELQEELAATFTSIRALPESQRTALVLAEMHGLSQADIAAVLGVRSEQVKAYIFQARSHLGSDREARQVDCDDIRKELASARGAARLKRRLRGHLRSCDACRSYANGISRRQYLGALLPVIPSIALKSEIFADSFNLSSSDTATYGNGLAAASPVAEVAGGGVAALIAKVAAGVVALSAGAGVGVSVLTHGSGVPRQPASHVAALPLATAAHTTELSETASAGPGSSSTERHRQRHGDSRVGGAGRQSLRAGAPVSSTGAGAGSTRHSSGGAGPGQEAGESGAQLPGSRSGHAERQEKDVAGAGGKGPTGASTHPNKEGGNGKTSKENASQREERKSSRESGKHERGQEHKQEEGPIVTSGAPESEEEALHKAEERKLKHEARKHQALEEEEQLRLLKEEEQKSGEAP